VRIRFENIRYLLLLLLLYGTLPLDAHAKYRNESQCPQILSEVGKIQCNWFAYDDVKYLRVSRNSIREDRGLFCA